MKPKHPMLAMHLDGAVVTMSKLMPILLRTPVQQLLVLSMMLENMARLNMPPPVLEGWEAIREDVRREVFERGSRTVSVRPDGLGDA